jgi:hypothetical protein
VPASTWDVIQSQPGEHETEISPVAVFKSPSDTKTGAISPKRPALEHARPGGRSSRPPRLPAAPPPVWEAAMTARPVPPVIPAASPGPRLGKPGGSRPLPLASPPGRPDVVYGFGRIDASGRVADRVTIAALGWRGGDRLTVTAEAGVMIARRDPGGMVTVPARPYMVIPAALRRRCGLRAGDHVLLAASPGQDTLAAYSFTVVDQALRDRAQVAGEGRRA